MGEWDSAAMGELETFEVEQRDAMPSREHRPPSAFEYLQEWRRLERQLEALVLDDPERAEVERELELVRHRYLELFDVLSNGAAEASQS